MGISQSISYQRDGVERRNRVVYKEIKTPYISQLWSLKFGREYSEIGQEPWFVELKNIGHF